MKTKLLIGAVSIVAFGLVAGGCEVTSEKIQTWKQSVKGAAKIRAAVRDTGQQLPIRIEAAVALGELGVSAALVDDLKSLDAGDRKTLMAGLVTALVGKMEGTNPQSSTKVQLQAKDALFALRELAEPPERETIGRKVSAWIVQDWRARNGGEHSGEKIITAVGEAAGAPLAEAIGRGGTPVVVAATLLRDVGSEADREGAGAALVALAGKQDPPQEQTFHALGKVGSQKALSYLREVVTKGAFEERLWALRALALYPHLSSVPLMTKIAADSTLRDDDALLRDEAFTVLEKIDHPKSLDALAGFLGSGEEKVRFRAVEAIVAGFKAKGLTKLLEGLPSRYTYKKEDLADFVEKDIGEIGSEALPALRGALRSDSWIARLIAVRVLGNIGTTEDIAALKKLADDRTGLKGWEGGATIGSEALAAMERINQRK